jgi:hypothetical protein
MMRLEEFTEWLKQADADGPADLDRLLGCARGATGQPGFEDDFSLMRIDFA